MHLVDGSAVKFRHVTSSPQTVPALEGSNLDVMVVHEHEDGEDDLENDDGEQAQRVEVQKAFCGWGLLVSRF